MDAEDDAAIVGATDEVDVSVMEEINWVPFCNVRNTRRREVSLRRGLGRPIMGRV